MLAESIGILSDVTLVFAQTSPLRKLLVFAWGKPHVIICLMSKYVYLVLHTLILYMK